MSRFKDLVSAGFLSVLFNRALSGGSGRWFSVFTLAAFAFWWMLSRIAGFFVKAVSYPFRSIRKEIEKEFRLLSKDAQSNGDVPGTIQTTMFSDRAYVAMTIRGEWRSNVVGTLFLGDVRTRALRVFELPFGGPAQEVPSSVFRESGIDFATVELNVSNVRQVYRKFRLHRY